MAGPFVVRMVLLVVVVMAAVDEPVGVVADGDAVDDGPVVVEEVLVHEAGFAADVGHEMRHADVDSVSFLVVVE